MAAKRPAAGGDEGFGDTGEATGAEAGGAGSCQGREKASMIAPDGAERGR